MLAVESPAPGLQLVGPLEISKVVIDGYIVPGLLGCLKDGEWHFSLEGFYSVSVPELYGHSVAIMIAQAMARAAGYTCFGKDSKPLNPFSRRAFYLGAAPEIDTMEPQGGEQ